MSDNIPFEIQMEIIKKVSNVKSLIHFRSVSKPWKSFIDSSEFIKGYGARHTQPQSFILSYISDLENEAKHYRLVDDDNNETFKVLEFAPSILSHLLKHYCVQRFIGACHGLVCFCGYNKHNYTKMLVIWNPCIGKPFGIALPIYEPVLTVYGFGVCPFTSDPTIVKLVCADNMPWHVEVFTLSSGVWTVIPSVNLPRQSIRLNWLTQVVKDRFIYWGACEETFIDNGESTTNHMLVSFDLITKEFKVVDLPLCLLNELNGAYVFVSKLRESLVVYRRGYINGAECCIVWMMEHDSSFKKLFTIDAPLYKILGFRNSGEPIFATTKELLNGVSTVDVYDPYSQQIKNLGISGVEGILFMGSYKESLLLLDHSDLQSGY